MMTKEKFLAGKHFMLNNSKFRYDGNCILRENILMEWDYEASTVESCYVLEDKLECFRSIMGQAFTVIVRWEEMEEIDN